MRAIVEPSSAHISGIQKTVSNASKPKKKIAMTVHYLEIEANIREKKYMLDKLQHLWEKELEIRR